MFVHQVDSHRFRERQLGRPDFVYGQLGDSFTVAGVSDEEVCIGHRYGSARPCWR